MHILHFAQSGEALSSETDVLETHFLLLSSFIHSYGEQYVGWRMHLVFFISNQFISN